MSALSRPVYRHAELRRLLAPQSVAIAGVSPKAGTFASRVLANVEASGYAGRIYPVNPRYQRIGERICHPSISSLPESPDCVLIALPREAVEPMVRECANRRAGGVVVLASGFAETGKPGRSEEQARLVQIASDADMRLIGPNCMGLINYPIGLLATFQAVPNPGPPAEPAIGIVSQSGALAFALVQALAHGTTFSHVLTSGNASDVDIADQISYLAEDASCKAIACLFEGMNDPERLVEAAAFAHAAGKPVVIYKTATGMSGARAALAHTASDAGDPEAYRALFKRAGIAAVDNFEALLETASFLAKAGRPKARGVAVVATSGGAGIMAADKAEKYGVPLPQPAPDVLAILEKVIPEFGSPRNPCDVTAQVLASPDALYAALNAFMGQGDIGAMIGPHVFAYDPGTERFRVYGEAAKRYGKIACIVWLSEYLEEAGSLKAERHPYLALFRSMDRCFAAIAAWHELEDWRRKKEHA